MYERAGVREYIVWLVHEREIRWFRLESDALRLVAPDAEGFIESTTFPGLRLDVPAMLALDTRKVLAGIGVSV